MQGPYCSAGLLESINLHVYINGNNHDVKTPVPSEPNNKTLTKPCWTTWDPV